MRCCGVWIASRSTLAAESAEVIELPTLSVTQGSHHRELLSVDSAAVTSVVLNGEIAQLSLGSTRAVTLTVNDTSRRLRVEGDVELGAAYSYRGNGRALDLSANGAIVQLNLTARALVSAVDAALTAKIRGVETAQSALVAFNTSIGYCRNGDIAKYGGHCQHSNFPSAALCWLLCASGAGANCVAVQYISTQMNCALLQLSIARPAYCPNGFAVNPGTATVPSYTGGGQAGTFCMVKR